MNDSPIFCEHANEMPRHCPCDDDCYCKQHSCKPMTPHRAIDPIYPRSSGMAGINRFDRFSFEELDMLMGVIRLWKPALKGDTDFYKKIIEPQRILASKLFGEIAQARCKNEQLAKRTNSAYPCPKCKKPSVYCGCSSSCNHGSATPLRYCNHCEESFSASSSCS